MKKICLLICYTLLSTIGAFAQADLFNDGLKQGRVPNEFYKLDNRKNKRISKSDLFEYAKANNYVIEGVSLKSVSRFGDVTYIANQAMFIPYEEYPAYLYHNIRQTKRFPYEALKQEGAALVFIAFPKFTKDWKAEQILYQVPNAKWSGAIKNGKIDGYGEGYLCWAEGPDKETVAYYFEGSFKEGAPIGKINYSYIALQPARALEEKEEKLLTGTVYCGPVSENRISFSVDNSLHGFLDTSSGRITVPPIYKQVAPYKLGQAVVCNDKNQEIIINKSGLFVDYTDKQKKLNAIKQKEEEDIRRQEEERKARYREECIRLEKARILAIKNAQPGDRIAYSQDWVHSEGVIEDWLFGKKNYSMKVICFVEQNVNNGERLQIRVGAVESSDDRYHSTPVIDGIRYNKGDVLWIRPLKDSGWIME